MNAEQNAREAMDVWREACQASQDAFYEADGMFAIDHCAQAIRQLKKDTGNPSPKPPIL